MSFKSFAKFGKKLIPLLSVVFIIVVAFFLYEALSAIEWSEVRSSLERVSPNILILTAATGIFSYLILTVYDYLGFNFLKTKTLEYTKVLPTALICYAFNFNLGAFIGGLGFRIRIYSGWNVPKKIIPLVALFSVTTTWIGYTLLMSFILLFQADWLSQELPISQPVSAVLGIAGFAIVAAYLILCHKEYKLKIKTRQMRFPPLRMAGLQLFLSVTQWCLPTTIIFLMMRHFGLNISYGETMSTFLIASVGGVLARIPAGIGVIEAIFLKLHANFPGSSVLAAILCFRAVYFLFPLALAVPGYAFIEFYQKKRTRVSATA